MIDRHRIVAAIRTPTGTVDLDVVSADLALDEARAPYGQARLVCAMPSPADRARLDLRDGELRLTVESTQDVGGQWDLADLTADIGGSMAALTALMGGQPLWVLTNRYYRPFNPGGGASTMFRAFDLYVLEREFDDVTQQLTVQAASDEARLLGDALIQSTPITPGITALRALCQLVLNRYGAVLQPGPDDAVVAEPDATVWAPGVRAWDYLNPMLEAASLRLWCDELRVWRLTERQSTLPGSVVLTPTGTMIGHRDTMTLDPDVWYDAVVIEYRWSDQATGATTYDYDVAGASPARSMLRLERNAPFPGPGAAQGILDRGRGRGRVVDIEAINDYRVTPGMAATIVPPVPDEDVASEAGYVAGVTWRLPDARMRVSTRTLIDVPPRSWLDFAVGLSWLEIPPGQSWLELTTRREVVTHGER